MSANTGKAIDGEQETTQSIGIILSTRVGTRLARREFGSDLPALVDQPMNAVTAQKLLGATAVALQRWLPALKMNRIQITKGDTPGAWNVLIDRPSTGSGSSQLALSLSL